MASKYAVIIPAAGKSERFGGGEKKTFTKIDGRPMFIRTLERFISRDDVCQTILAVAPEDGDAMRSTYSANLGFMGVKLVEGGATRAQTVLAALSAVADEADFIAVHDAARPCVTPAMIDGVFAEAAKTGAAILAVPIIAMLKRVSDRRVIEQTVPRESLFEAQTPQVFRKDVLINAYSQLDALGGDITDDSQLVELAGHPVSVVISDASNLKVTGKGDIALANALIKSRPAKPAKRLGAFEEAQW